MTRDELALTARTHAWVPLIAAAVVSTGLVAAQIGDPAPLSLQVAALLLVSGVGDAFDDAAFEMLGPSPSSLLRRRVRRLTVVLPVAVGCWIALLAWHGTAGTEETIALGATFAGMLGLGLGAAGIAQRRSGRGVGGYAVGPTLFVLLLLSTTVPPRWRPLPIGDIPGGWAAIYLRWGAAALVGVGVCLASSRDRATRSFLSPAALPRPERRPGSLPVAP